MKRTSNAGRAAIDGLVAGVALASILCVATSALAALTGTTVGVPGFFMARTAQESGALAVVFTPGWGGVALIAFAAAIAIAVMAARRS